MKFISYDNGLRVLFYSVVLASLPCSALARAHASPLRVAYFQQTITGTVSDASGALPGVIVMVKGSTRSTISDADGKFSIAASAGDVLVFSFTGYKTVEVVAGAQSSLSITLQEDSTQLEELTINAGYYSVKQKESTGSIARITAKDIEKQPVANVLATMQGRMAGVNVIQNSGMPGGGFDIEIRGINSLRMDGNSPLYIIDGVPYSSQSIGSTYTSGNMPVQNSPLNSINPADIAAIEILKDADATAIYGSRGANGVVLITTKKGQQGKTTFSADYTGGIGRVTNFMSLMNTQQYLAMRREAFQKDGVSQYPASAYDVNGTWDQERYTDWQKELIGGTAQYNTLQASLSGGSSQTQFLVSGSFNKQTTVFPGDFQYKRANGHVNVNHQSADSKFKITFSCNYTVQDNDMPTADLTRDAITLAPNAPALYDEQGNLNWEGGTFNNPLAKIEGTIKSKTYDLLANSVISYDLGAGFLVKGNFGYTDLRQNQLNLLPSTTFNPSYGLGSEVSSVFDNTLQRNSYIAEPQLTWDMDFGKAKIQLLAGSTFQEQQARQTVTMGEGFSSNSLIENPASAAYTTVLSSDESIYRYQAFFGRANFNWDGKYIINLTGRRDGSSRFGPGKKFAYFGAVGGAWLFSKEKFMEKIPFLSLGKLRASYGTSGNDQIGDYQYLDTYSISGSTYQGVAGLMPSRLFNPEYGWETNQKLELALELGFLKDKIRTTLSFFNNRSSSQLVGIPLPSTTGFSELMGNLDATVQNSGFECSVGTTNISHRDFEWSSNFNISFIKNKLVSFPNLEGSTYANRYIIGEPLNIVRVYHYTGIDPQSGRYTFEDINGDGAISATEDKGIIKDLNPKYYGGLQNQLRYKGITLDFLLQFVKQLNFNENYRMPMPGTMANQATDVTSHWQAEGADGDYQAYSNSNALRRAANTFFTQSDAAIGDASFIRLKNVSLSYALPKEWTKKFTCSISFQGQNLMTWTAYKGVDPEFRSSGYLPPLKVFITGIHVTF